MSDTRTDRYKRFVQRCEAEDQPPPTFQEFCDAAVSQEPETGHTHICPDCDSVWDCEETECPEEYECPTCHAETKGIEPPKDSAVFQESEW